MKDVLTDIIANTKIEVEQRKAQKSAEQLISEIVSRPKISMKQSLANSTSGIISEFKRRSPSKGWIKQDGLAAEITSGYQRSGASAVSILTDEKFFGGSMQDVISSRAGLSIPILRKDFIIDEYQILEAKLIGADAILLIAAALTPDECERLAKFAHDYDLEVLLELHSESELDHVNQYVDMVGVNNRNLGTFHTDIQNSFDLAEKLPKHVLLVSESGISDAETVKKLRAVGFRGFLIGENFMKTSDSALALKKFIADLKFVKVCGMRDSENIEDVDRLKIDIMGFIFYPKSPRYVSEKPDFLPKRAKKAGVFVNEKTEKILEIAKDFGLDYLQLHGNESVEQCEQLKAHGYKIIKAFAVSEALEMVKTVAYEQVADFFVFDTPCHTFGGSGKTFAWDVLKYYTGSTPFLLSGGLSLESLEELKAFSHPKFAGIDLNSGFEDKPAMKNPLLLKTFILNFKDHE